MLYRFQLKVQNGCLDLMQEAMSFNDVTIVSDKKMIIEFIFVYESK